MQCLYWKRVLERAFFKVLGGGSATSYGRCNIYLTGFNALFPLIEKCPDRQPRTSLLYVQMFSADPMITLLVKTVIGKDLRVRQGDCGSVKTERRDNLEGLMMGRFVTPETWLEDKLMKRSDCKVSSKAALEDSRRVALGDFLHFQGWKSIL